MLVRTVTGFTLVLVLSTWRLWTGQQAFPQVPLFEFAVAWPRWLDNVSTGILLGGLTVTLVAAESNRWRRLGLSLAVAGLALLWTTDQHRLQPWAYHFALSAWVLIFFPSPGNRRWLRALIVSVYLYSALSKVDARFLQTNGSMMVSTALDLLGVGAGRVDRETLSRLAVALPLGELATGLLLAVPRLRGAGRGSAVLLHASLIALLGPWGMNHRWGVLIWNVAFLAQVLILFERPAAPAPQRARDTSARPPRLARQLAALPILAAVTLPALEPFEFWDSWLSWGLYSTRAAKLELYLPRAAAPRLPPSLRALTDVPFDVENRFWIHVPIDRWSLESLQAPIYPQQRFQLGVALAVLDLLPADERHLLVIASLAPDRRTGAVQRERWEGTNELQTRADRYWFNAQPRRRKLNVRSDNRGARVSAARYREQS